LSCFLNRFLTLNTEDERRDEAEAALTAASGVRLEGDVITANGSIISGGLPVLDSYSVLNAGYACSRHGGGSPAPLFDHTLRNPGSTGAAEVALSDSNNNLSTGSVDDRSMLALGWHPTSTRAPTARHSNHSRSRSSVANVHVETTLDDETIDCAWTAHDLTMPSSSASVDCECGANDCTRSMDARRRPSTSITFGRAMSNDAETGSDSGEWLALTEAPVDCRSTMAGESRRKTKLSRKEEERVCSCSCYRAKKGAKSGVEGAAPVTGAGAVGRAAVKSAAQRPSSGVKGSSVSTVRQRRPKKGGNGTGQQRQQRLNAQSQSLLTLRSDASTATSANLLKGKPGGTLSCSATACSSDCGANCEKAQLLFYSPSGGSCNVTSAPSRPRSASFKRSTGS
jgi:hypothetical protein